MLRLEDERLLPRRLKGKILIQRNQHPQGNNLQITDFEGLRGMVEGSLWKSKRGRAAFDARLELKTGLYHSTGQYVSGKFSLGARFNNLRTTLFYFDGYGKDLSTYHLRTKYVGFGLELR